VERAAAKDEFETAMTDQLTAMTQLTAEWARLRQEVAKGERVLEDARVARVAAEQGHADYFVSGHHECAPHPTGTCRLPAYTATRITWHLDCMMAAHIGASSSMRSAGTAASLRCAGRRSRARRWHLSARRRRRRRRRAARAAVAPPRTPVSTSTRSRCLEEMQSTRSSSSRCCRTSSGSWRCRCDTVVCRNSCLQSAALTVWVLNRASAPLVLASKVLVR
jgi:hypothetical protein